MKTEETTRPRSLPGGASWMLRCCLWFDQRARVTGSPPGFLRVIVRLVIEIIMKPRYRTAAGV
jgi:hypothetical protein